MVSFSEMGPPLTESELTSLEFEIGTRLPESYRRFLLSNNGGRPNPSITQVPGLPGGGETDLDFIFGIGAKYESCDIRWNLKTKAQSIPAGFVPIGVDSGGSLFLLTLDEGRRGQIFYQDAGNSFYSKQGDIGKLFSVADNFESLLNQLKNLGQ